MIKGYIIKETLGKGSYGIVYKVQKINTNDKISFPKIIDKVISLLLYFSFISGINLLS